MIVFVSSKPLTLPFNDISIINKSYLLILISSKALLASFTDPETLISSLLFRSCLSPSLTIGWSSTIKILICFLLILFLQLLFIVIINIS